MNPCKVADILKFEDGWQVFPLHGSDFSPLTRVAPNQIEDWILPCCCKEDNIWFAPFIDKAVMWISILICRDHCECSLQHWVYPST